MEIAMTRVSQNGQVVIPKEIRDEAKLTPRTKLVVFQQDGVIMLKRASYDDFRISPALARTLAKAEAQIKRGEYISVPAGASAKEIRDALMGARWNSSSAKTSTRSTSVSKTKRR